jgi:tetraacyldisaccharide 4'-kinase
MESLQARITRAWHSNYSWVLLLWPVSIIFRLLACLRRCILQSLYQGQQFLSPVVVVGNISVGGSGKTPLIISLAKQLIDRGLSIAIVSRGYGAKASSYPISVEMHTLASECGDEPLLIRHSLPLEKCHVVVDPDRRRAVNYALECFKPDLILCDDGLQHYRLHRDVEIAVIDGSRGFGNKHCLPTGPLREPIARLKSVDFVMVNGEHTMNSDIAIDGLFKIKPTGLRHLASGKVISIDDWAESKTVHALAAIGNPQRFADILVTLGFMPILLGFDDHETMVESDLVFEDDYPVIITAKDAIKFTATDLNHVWVLDVEAEMPPEFINSLLATIDLNPSK